LQGADASTVLDYLSPNLAADILDATGTPVDHVVEVEFGKNIDALAQVIAERGRIVTYGSALAMTRTLPFYPLLVRKPFRLTSSISKPRSRRSRISSTNVSEGIGGHLRLLQEPNSYLCQVSAD
jgi:NADPH:quinone reductase-like Zn-dependent oxidoreductase